MVGRGESFGFRMAPWRLLRIMPTVKMGVRYKRVM
jgi:hypothetical protein